MREPFDAILRQLSQAPLSDDPLKNLQVVTIAPHATTLDELAAFIEAAITAWRQQCSQRGLRMWFYCWFDEQASQFRLSACPVSAGKLPFGCQLRLVPMRAIAMQCLMLANGGTISLCDCEVINGPVTDTHAAHILDVYQCEMP